MNMRYAVAVRRAAIAAAATGVLALAGGCTLFGSTKQPPDPLPTPGGAAAVSPAWSYPLGAKSGVGFAPVAVGNSVWAAAQDGTVVRLDLESGRQLWRVSAGKPLTAGVGTDGTLAVVVARDGTVLAYDADGQPKWATPIGTEVVTAPAVGGDTVLLRTSDNRIIAFDADSGKRRWTFQRQNPTLVLRQSGGFAMAPGAAFIGMPGGRLVALALNNGALRWDVPLAQPRGATELERVADVVGSPLLIGRELCAVTYQGRIGCVDAVSGQPVWLREFSSAVGLDVDGEGVVAPDADDVIRAFDRSGAPTWQQKGYARRRLSAPLIVGRWLAVGDVEGNVLWLARSGGRLEAVSRTDGTPIVASPAAGAGRLLVQTSGGALHAFRVE